jgi:sugar lactone lactonase YvrE
VRKLLDGFGLLEAARWYQQYGLLFSDMTEGGVYRYRGGVDSVEAVIAHRKGIGGLVAHSDGGLLVAGRNVAHKSSDGTTTVLLETASDETFFNDLTADGHGRLYVGSVGTGPSPNEKSAGGGERSPGRLYRVDLDGSRATLADDVLVSNGLGMSPTDDVLYHVDSHRHVVWAFREAGDREVFVDVTEYHGVPDGLAVAADGSVWVAMAGGGLVVGWGDDGRRIAEYAVPQALVTSVCFGGPQLSSLFVLSGVNAEYPGDEGGAVRVVDDQRAGLPAPLCAVPLPRPQAERTASYGDTTQI